MLQPNDYMQNHLGDVFGSLPHKSLSYPHTSSVARIVDARDVGEVGAKLLLLGAEARAAHHGQRYHVCGPSGVSVRGLAALYETALSLPAGAVACVEGLSEAAFAESLVAQAGMPRWLAVAARVAKYQKYLARPARLSDSRAVFLSGRAQPRLLGRGQARLPQLGGGARAAPHAPHRGGVGRRARAAGAVRVAVAFSIAWCGVCL